MSYVGCYRGTHIQAALLRRHSNTGSETREPASGLLSCWDDNREAEILGMGA